MATEIGRCSLCEQRVCEDILPDGIKRGGRRMIFHDGRRWRVDEPIENCSARVIILARQFMEDRKADKILI